MELSDLTHAFFRYVNYEFIAKIITIKDVVSDYLTSSVLKEREKKVDTADFNR